MMTRKLYSTQEAVEEEEEDGLSREGGLAWDILNPWSFTSLLLSDDEDYATGLDWDYDRIRDLKRQNWFY